MGDGSAVTRIIVTADGGRAFSAGGDLRALYDLGRAGRQDEALDFFRAEYALNTQIKFYRKPYVALIDGIVMGGGVGISVHGSHRVAGDRFTFAMPEVGIGFFPDIGATWFLPRLPGELGAYCALTGERLNAADAVAAGIATHRVASKRMPSSLKPSARTYRSMRVLNAFAEPSPRGRRWCSSLRLTGSFVRARRGCPCHPRCGGDGKWSAGQVAFNAAALLRAKSPTSLKIALAQMRRGPTLDFVECMRTEFRIVSRVMRGHDFYEGVRAVIIDKDEAPHWQPHALEEVSVEEIQRCFAPQSASLSSNGSRGPADARTRARR